MREPTGELPHDVPVELGRLTRSMLAKDASKRPHAGQVAAQLDKILAASGAPKVRAGHRRWWIPTLAAGMAIAAAGVWLTESRPRADDLADLTIRPLTSQSGWERVSGAVSRRQCHCIYVDCHSGSSTTDLRKARQRQ